jgi:hypothetical protein
MGGTLRPGPAGPLGRLPHAALSDVVIDDNDDAVAAFTDATDGCHDEYEGSLQLSHRETLPCEGGASTYGTRCGEAESGAGVVPKYGTDPCRGEWTRAQSTTEVRRAVLPRVGASGLVRNGWRVDSCHDSERQTAALARRLIGQSSLTSPIKNGCLFFSPNGHGRHPTVNTTRRGLAGA